MAKKHSKKTGRAPSGNRISASEFKTHCLSLMDRVQQTREEITVTKYGKPVAKLVPITPEKEWIFGHLKGLVTQYGDLVSPIDERWEADD